MGNFLLKRRWSNQDWDVFDSNINILLNEYRLKKGEFNDTIGVKNFFRKDRQRVSLRVIDKICKEFNIERDWLEISHKFQDRKIFTTEKSPKSDPVPGIKLSQAFTLLSKIYEHGDNQLINAAFAIIQALADLVDKHKIDADSE